MCVILLCWLLLVSCQQIDWSTLILATEGDCSVWVHAEMLYEKL
jgi:hypothetical protein